MKKCKGIVFLSVFLWTLTSLLAQSPMSFDRYHTVVELNKALENFVVSYPQFTRLHKIAVSPGKNAVLMLEIGPEVGEEKTLPAVLVVANLEGAVPLASEGALFLAQSIMEKPELRKDKTWYVLPCGNPDAGSRYFAKPLHMDVRNVQPFNDDLDDQTDEDGVDDLDGNRIITMMRVKDPQGEWIPVPGEPRLMKKANNSKGEKGEYKLYTEGFDNDKDGRYNEDGVGGVNIGINFPHLFQFHTKTGGSWAGSEEETYNLIKFISEHREIGLTFCFGSTNFCLVPPRGGRKGSVDMDRIKIPERLGERFGIDTERTYTMKEIMEMVQSFIPVGMEVTESMVASYLGLGAVVNPLPQDLEFYKALSEKYKEYLKKNNLDSKRLETARAKDGSFELWAYYHLGIPSFSLDFWTLPDLKEKGKEKDMTAEKLEQMSNEDFIALGEERIDDFLRSVDAPPHFKAKEVIAMVKSGQMTTKKMAEMLKQMPKPESEESGDPKEKALLAFSDQELEGKGYLAWKSFKHPTLGEVEIGGAVPFADTTPPPSKIEVLLKGQVPWVFEIVQKMASIKIAKTEVKALSSGLYYLKVWVENRGYLPYPTAMGKRNNRIIPVILTLEGKDFEIIEGKKRTLIKAIDGHKTQMTSWIIRSEKPSKITVRAWTRIAWQDAQTVTLGENQ